MSRGTAWFERLSVCLVITRKTGAAKTISMLALVEEARRHERRITIEDTAELLLPSHDPRARPTVLRP